MCPVQWGIKTMIKMRAAVAAVAALSVAACATHPNKISAAYVSPMKYQNYDCGQIAVERAAVEQRTNALYHTLKRRNNSDNWMMGIGMLVAWPALLFMKGNNTAQNSEYAQLKGDYEALRSVSVAKRCDVAFANDLATTVNKSAPPPAAAAPVTPGSGN